MLSFGVVIMLLFAFCLVLFKVIGYYVACFTHLPLCLGLF